MVRLYGEAHLSPEWAQGGKPVVPFVLGARKDGAESQQLNDPRANQPLRWPSGPLRPGAIGEADKTTLVERTP